MAPHTLTDVRWSGWRPAQSNSVGLLPTTSSAANYLETQRGVPRSVIRWRHHGEYDHCVPQVRGAQSAGSEILRRVCQSPSTLVPRVWHSCHRHTEVLRGMRYPAQDQTRWRCPTNLDSGRG
jgi:hypothetical protein